MCSGDKVCIVKHRHFLRLADQLLTRAESCRPMQVYKANQALL